MFGMIVSTVGCGKDPLCSNQEVARQSSPDEIVDAMVLKTDCGATTSYSYRVFITPRGESPISDEIFLADKVENLNIFWISPKSLLITYTGARIFTFKNFWQSKEINNSQYVVSITEQKRTDQGNHYEHQ